MLLVGESRQHVNQKSVCEPGASAPMSVRFSSSDLDIGEPVGLHHRKVSTNLRADGSGVRLLQRLVGQRVDEDPQSSSGEVQRSGDVVASATEELGLEELGGRADPFSAGLRHALIAGGAPCVRASFRGVGGPDLASSACLPN